MDRNQLIEHHMDDMTTWVKSFVRSNPKTKFLEDDFLAEANLQLIRLIDSYLAENKIFPEHFSHILRIVSRRAIVTVQRLEHGRGRQFEHVTVPARFFPSTVEDPEYVDRSVESDLLSACKDQTDAVIISGLANGETRVSIARRLGTTRLVVMRRLEKIEKRFYRVRDEKPSF